MAATAPIDILAGQFTLDDQGRRRYFKSLEQILEELQDGIEPATVLGPLAESHKTITSMHFPDCEIRLFRHSPNECGWVFWTRRCYES